MDLLAFRDVLENLLESDEGGWKLHQVPGDKGGITYGGVALANLEKILPGFCTEYDVEFRGPTTSIDNWVLFHHELMSTMDQERSDYSLLDAWKDTLREWYFDTYNSQVTDMCNQFPWNTTSAAHCLSVAINMRPQSIVRISQHGANFYRGKVVLKPDGIFGPKTNHELGLITATYDTLLTRVINGVLVDVNYARARECLIHAVYDHYTDIVGKDYYDDDGDVDQAKFLQGWVNRVRRGFLKTMRGA